MAPTSSTTTVNRKSKENNLVKYYRKYGNIQFLKKLLFDVEYLKIVSILILIAEFILNIFIIQRVPYTEIDWIAYMQECEGFLNGSTNYDELKGDTGPLVYPAGFVYIYSILYFVTSNGTNIPLAQYIFAFIYLLQMYLVLRLYTMSRKVPPFVLILSAFTSYRIHSIYVLRLFNDPIAILFLYAAINLFMERKWTLGSICFSIGVSVKMNILLFAPALLMLYLTNLGYLETIKQLMVCALVQLSLGSPFLLTYPVAYLRGSFDFGRIFEHKWTVNYRFLSREFFEWKLFHIGLLILHLLLLGLFAKPCYMFFQNYYRLKALQDQLQPQIDRENARQSQMKATKKLKNRVNNEEKLTKDQEKFLQQFEKTLKKSAEQSKISAETGDEIAEEKLSTEKLSIHFEKSTQLAILPLFLCNFIGIICSRSLHYQFYIWYFHTLPYLTWFTDYNLPLRYLILGLIEYCWNTYPSTNVSSLILHCCHIILLVGIGKKLFKTKSDIEKNKKDS